MVVCLIGKTRREREVKKVKKHNQILFGVVILTFLGCSTIWAQVVGQTISGKVTTESALVQKNNELTAEKQRLDLKAQELEQKRLALVEIEKEMSALSAKAKKAPTGSEEQIAAEKKLHALEITHRAAKPEYELAANAFHTEHQIWLKNFKTYSIEYRNWDIEQEKKKEEALIAYKRQWAHEVLAKKKEKSSLAGIPYDQLDQKFEVWYNTEEANTKTEVGRPRAPATIIEEWHPQVKSHCRLCGKFNCDTIHCKGTHCTRCGRLLRDCKCTGFGFGGNLCRYCGQNECNEQCISNVRKDPPTRCTRCGKKKGTCNCPPGFGGKHCGICGEYDCNGSCSPHIKSERCPRCGNWGCNGGCGEGPQ